jgi:hypothetical protein
MYVLPASKKCRALWPIKFIKGARPGLKRPAQVTVQQMQKKDLDMKRRKDLNGFSTQNGAKAWLKYDRDENVMTCTICTKYGKRGETGNLKKLALEVEHEIEREFILIKCIE